MAHLRSNKAASKDAENLPADSFYVLSLFLDNTTLNALKITYNGN